MGKNGRKNRSVGSKSVESNVKQTNFSECSTKTNHTDTNLFSAIFQNEYKQGIRLALDHDYMGALIKFEKSLSLLPKHDASVCDVRCKMVHCCMSMGLNMYPKAIEECNLVLEFSPTNAKALLSRAKCYESLYKFDFAYKDVHTILKMEPNNIVAKEIEERVKTTMEKSQIKAYTEKTDLPLDKSRMKSNQKLEERIEQEKIEEKKISTVDIEERKMVIKFVFGEDIRRAKMPINCNVVTLGEIIIELFPSLKAYKIKYRDQEGDMVTITSDEELMFAEESAKQNGTTLRFYIIKVEPDQDPFFKKLNLDAIENNAIETNQKSRKGDWVIQFAQHLKNHVGFSSDMCLDLHEQGINLYSAAMNNKVKSLKSKKLFDKSEVKFQEMTALSLFNLGNIHMTRARKRVLLTRDPSKQSLHAEVESTYKWAQTEYLTAQMRYEASLKVKPNFCEGVVAIGQQQFELAKLSWYFAISSNVDLEKWDSDEVMNLYNSAEMNMGKGISILNELGEKGDSKILKVEINGLMQDVAADQGNCMRSQIYLLWGTMLYERSVMEYKLGLPVWQECLEVSVEKFERAGASKTDTAVMIKNHCSNNTALEGFDIDEMVQAWCEMDDAKRWQTDVSSPRSEVVLRRRGSKLHHALEYA